MLEYEFEIYKNEILKENKPILISGDENSYKFIFKLPRGLLTEDTSAYVFNILCKRPGREVERYLGKAYEKDKSTFVEWILSRDITNGAGKIYLQIEVVGNKFSWRSSITDMKVDVKIEDKVLKEEELILSEFYTKKQVDKLIESLSYTTSVEIRQAKEDILQKTMSQKEVENIVSSTISKNEGITEDEVLKLVSLEISKLDLQNYLKKGEIYEVYKKDGRPHTEGTGDMNNIINTGIYSYNNTSLNVPDRAKEGILYVVDGGDLKVQIATTNSGKVFVRIQVSGFWINWKSLL